MRAWPRAKKGGTDAWEATFFKDLPLELLNWLAGILRQVEDGEPWPPALAEGLVCLLPRRPQREELWTRDR